MGAAHCTVVNQTTRPLCVITFNMADLMYKTYHTMYIVDPGDIQVVEANPDAIGLKVGVVYDAKRFKQEFSFHRFTCQNDSTLTITSIDGDDVDYYGEGTNLQGKNALREMDVDAFNLAAASLRVDLARESDKPTNQATQDVKKFINNVKHKSEEVLTKVTGKEVSLDFPKTGFSGPEGIVRVPSSTSLSHVHISNSNEDFNSSIHTAPEQSKPNQLPVIKQPAATSSASSVSPASTPAKSNSSTNNRGNAGSPVNIPNSSNNNSSQPPPTPEDSRAAMERFQAELERLKKEKQWEQEVERVRKERLQRAELEEEFHQHPEKFPQIQQINKDDSDPTTKKQAPVVDKAGCSVCVVS